MNIMVKDLLLISQIESGYFKMSKSSLDISGILESCLHRFEILIKEKGLKVSNDLGETIIVSANKDGIEKVLNNLLSNAVKYCQEGGKIKIGVEEHREKVKVFIYNSSNKIAMGELDKIWTPFYKLDKSGSKKYGGTGLGLAIVKEILEKHGSEYGVDLLEDGLEFYFYLEKNRETTDY
jgi:signal transduction histidine kinase